MKNVMLVLTLLVGMVLAHTWSDPQAIVATDSVDMVGGSGTYCQVMDSRGTLHLVFFSDFEEPGNREIYYMNNEGGTWSEPLRLSWGEGMSHVPSMAIDGKGNITVVWYDYRLNYPYGDVFWCRYDASAGTWSNDEPLVVKPRWHSLAPLVVAEPGGKVHLVWCDGPGESRTRFELHYCYWENGQWSDEVPLTDIGVGDRWAQLMVLDETGTLHLLWADDRTARNDWHVYYKTLSPNGVWSEELNLGPGMPHDVVICTDLLFLSQTCVQDVELGMYDPPEGIPTQVEYSVKSIYDPNDVWLLEGQSVSPAGDFFIRQAALGVSYSGVRLVWSQGVEGHYCLYQATVSATASSQL